MDFRFPAKAAAFLAACTVLPAQALVFNFDVTFDGVSATVDAGSDPVAGTTLIPGTDGFILDIHAAGNDFWSVNPGGVGLSIYAGLSVSDSGMRTSNVTTSFLLDGVVQTQDVDLGTTQSFVHMGGQQFNLTGGTLFDQVIVDLTFLSSTSTFTTIQSSPDVIAFTTFFRDPNITYNQGDVDVPAPATLALIGLGLAGLGHRRKQGKAA